MIFIPAFTVYSLNAKQTSVRVPGSILLTKNHFVTRIMCMLLMKCLQLTESF